MVDVHSPQTPLTIHLPAELIEEMRVLAREKNLSIDEVVMEACLAYSEPYTWERTYKSMEILKLPIAALQERVQQELEAWRQAHPEEAAKDFGIAGDGVHPFRHGSDK